MKTGKSCNFRSVKLGILTFALLILTIRSNYAGNNPSLSNTRPSGIAENVTENQIHHNFYLGAKLGLIYVLGIELNYIIQSQDINRVYLAAAVQSSLIVNSINAGGGVFLGKTGIGVGCRYHHLLWFEDEIESKIRPGYGPEIVWNRTIGTKYIINLHAGGIVSKGSFFPDISFGVFLPLNR